MIKKLNNKGFSLVELIIVIAIIAILAAVLAPQFIRFIEDGRESNDVSNAKNIETVVNTLIADGTINVGDVVTWTTADGTLEVEAGGTADTDAEDALYAQLSLTATNASTSVPELQVESTNAKGTATVTWTIAEGTGATDGMVTVVCNTAYDTLWAD